MTQFLNFSTGRVKLFASIFILSVCFVTFSANGFAESIQDRVNKAGSSTYEADRAKIRAKANEILNELYLTQPESRAAIKNAVGYAVFTNFGMKIFLAGGGKGKGLAVENKTGRETFMKMLEIQAGLGIGVKQFRLIWVFESQKAFDRFINSGWELGGQATAAAQINDVGGSYQGAVAVAPGVWLYQLTGNGLALELTAKGTKYYQDKDLNTR